MPLLDNVASATITLYKIEEVVQYQSELYSSNGNIFHPYDLETTLNFIVYKSYEDITKQFTDIEWKRYSYETENFIEDETWGEKYKNLSSIRLHKDDIKGKCLVQVDAYTMINNIRTCVASSRITLIDVNELYSNDIPPVDPIDGMLWVDTSGSKPIIYSWNDVNKKWVLVGKSTPFVRNLIRNSNFWKLNHDYFFEENSDHLLNLIVEEAFDKKWLRLKSFKPTVSERSTAGIIYKTTYPIEVESDYTLSFLVFRKNDIEYTGQDIYVKVFSENNLGDSTELLTEQRSISDTEMTQLSFSFKSLVDTTSIKAIIGVEPMKMSDFYITELSIYNTNSYYPWELAPEDVTEQLDSKLDNDHDSVFNALTRNGIMEGIYKLTDENGNEHFYFNATHIKSGSIDGGLINGIGLNIKDEETGQSVFHVYKDDKGTHIDMIANNLYIGTKPASTIDYVDNSIQTSEETTKVYIDTSVSTSESDTKAYVDDTVSAVETNTKAYVDETVLASDSNAKAYVDSAVSISEVNTKAYIDSTISTVESNAKNYVDSSVSASETSTKSYVTTALENLKVESDASLDGSLSSFDAEIKAYISDIESSTKTSCNEYTNNTISTYTAPIESDINDIKTKISDSEIVRTVRSSIDYINDLDGKVNKSDFEAYKIETNFSVSNTNSSITALTNRIVELENKNSEMEALIAQLRADIDSLLNP